jgi:6-phosphogluconate dehydrogenase
MATSGADIGVIGLAVMGQNLVLNLSDNGWDVAVYNRSPERTQDFVAGGGRGRAIVGTYDPESFVGALAKPRKIMIMIKAGQPIDDQIEVLLPFLEQGDIIIDGGNSLFTDTERRAKALAKRGIRFIGAGISGGEEGARYGPSIMPGGDPLAWPIVEPILTSIAGRAADDEPVAAYLGPGGSGHFVKMVHNGIEYADMQVIAEAHDFMLRGLGMAAAEQQQMFATWDQGPLNSYLIEITADLLGHAESDGTPTIDLVLDAAGQKGTGKWTVVASMEDAVPTTLVAESVYARMTSALVDVRSHAASILGNDVQPIEGSRDEILSDLHDALYASKIISYAQGFMLFDAASEDYGWDLDPGVVASLWRAGCIIRSHFLADITNAYRANPDLRNILFDDYFVQEVTDALPGWRRTVGRATASGIPTPAYSSALAFYDSFRSERLPANLIQAQRDYFGAHTYERIDKPRGEWFHTDWTGEGGGVTSGTYTA